MLCKEIMRGENHVRRENNVRMTPKISAYLRGLNLSTQREAEYGGEDILSAPPVGKKVAFPCLVFGKEKV